MKNIFKKAFVFVAILFATFTITNLTSNNSVFAESSCRDFLGMASWDCNINDAWKGEETITSNIWIIVTNIANDMAVIAAYLILGFVIYGGYQYLFAGGDVGKTLSGKKTLKNAFIGLAVVTLSKVVMNTLHMILLGNSGAFSGSCATTGVGCISPADIVSNTINWIIGVAGFICAVYVVIGGITYITSSGDPSKIKKAKDTILHAIIGLVIVGLSFGITAFVTNLINNSKNDAASSSAITTLVV